MVAPLIGASSSSGAIFRTTNFIIRCLWKRNFDSIVVLAVSGPNFRSMWSASLGFTTKASRVHTKSKFCCRKIKYQSNSLNSVRFCNISVRPGDHAQFLETPCDLAGLHYKQLVWNTNLGNNQLGKEQDGSSSDKNEDMYGMHNVPWQTDQHLGEVLIFR